MVQNILPLGYCKVEPDRGGALAIVVTLVGGVAVLLLVWVMVDNQFICTEPVTATVGTWFVIHF